MMIRDFGQKSLSRGATGFCHSFVQMSDIKVWKANNFDENAIG
jgi:hypothetical protein